MLQYLNILALRKVHEITTINVVSCDLRQAWNVTTLHVLKSCLALCPRVLFFLFVVASFGEEGARLCASPAFVCLFYVSFCPLSLPLCVGGWLRFVALPGLFCWLFEPRHDKTNKMSVRPAKTQISLGIRLVWSESSLCAQWVAKGPKFLQADSEDSDQTGRMARLIWVFAGRTLILLVLSCRGSFCNRFLWLTKSLKRTCSSFLRFTKTLKRDCNSSLLFMKLKRQWSGTYTNEFHILP